MNDYHSFHKDSLSKLFEVYKNINMQLNVENFGFLKVNKNSKYFYLNSDEKSAQEYLKNVTSSNVFFKDFLGMKHLNGVDYYFVLWPEKPQNHSMSIYLQNGYWNGLSVVAYSGDDIKIWWIAASPENATIKNLYHNELYRTKFLIAIDYFNKKSEQLIDGYGVKFLPKYDLFDFSLPIEKEKNKQDHLKKEKELIVKSFYPNGILVSSRNGIVKLTPKEVTVLSLLSDGYSAKQIASLQNNETKTIERHKEALKSKTGYTVKSDLVKLFRNQISFLFTHIALLGLCAESIFYRLLA